MAGLKPVGNNKNDNKGNTETPVEQPKVEGEVIEQKPEEDIVINIDANKQEEKPKESKVKMVNVTAAVNHKCYIGGKWYYFTKGKSQDVPKEVKDILNLSRDRILMP
jgi:hypothetical protein